VAGKPAVVVASKISVTLEPPPPSVTLTMLPEAFLVNIAGELESHRIASSCVSRSPASGTAEAV
jgi:hypothetical protein